MTDRELWIQIRRLILAAIVILDKHYEVGKGAIVPVDDNDDMT